jgi:CHAT domain-containing protein
VLEENSLVWVISRNEFETRGIPVGKSELARKVNEYSSLVAAPSGNKIRADRLAEELYGLLIAPVEGLLSKSKTVVIVSDKSLNYLPFITLRSPKSKRYLIEDHEIELSPSANIFVTSSLSAATRETGKNETLLSVGNPNFDREVFSDLPDLPSAGREAEAIRVFYKSAGVFVGANAREAIVKQRMKTADVIHLALHYVIDPKNEMLSELALTKEENPKGDLDGRLRSSEIYQMKLPRTRLAVLSACQTGIDRNFDGEGAVGMARPFLAAGVPVVVASLWPVESDSTAELMIQFHKNRTMGGYSTPKALRLAQLELLRSPELGFQHAYHWAAFAVIGGHAGY